MIKIKLREVLWEKDITGIELHKATGISQSKISEIIRGKRVNVTLETIERMCLFLECKIEDLIEISK